MTPLKTPIVLRIETAEEALCVWHRLNNNGDRDDYFPSSPVYLPTQETYDEQRGIFGRLDEAMQNLALDPRKPIARPLTIGGRLVESQPDGSIRFGGTKITRETLLKVLELSDAEVKKGAGSEWPKFMRHPKDREGILEFRQDHRESLWHSTDGEKLEILIYKNIDEAKARGWFPITPAEASESLKGAK